MRVKAAEGQDYFDISLQYFGDIENLFDIFADNDDLNLNTNLVHAQEIVIESDDKGNVINKDFFTRNEHIIVNKDDDEIVLLGDYNIDYNNDYDV